MNLLLGDQLIDLNVGEVELIPTGVEAINATVEGLMRGGIHLIAGATGSGKSLFLLHSAIQTAINNQDTPVVYISFENDIRIDRDRYIKALDTYHIVDPLDNLIFVLDANDCDDVFSRSIDLTIQKKKENIDTLSDLFKIPNSIIFVDGAEYQMSGADDGSKLFEQGKKLMTLMSDSAKKNNSCIICAWQFARGTSHTKIENLSTDDLSMSIAVARIATTVWAIKKTPTDWQIINIKSRQEVIDEPKAFSLYDRNHKFNVKCLRSK